MALLFHATKRDALSSIAEEGLRELSYWSDNDSVCAYYSETIKEEGDESVILVIDLDALVRLVGNDAIEPDHPGIDEPITGALDKREEEIWEAWDESRQDWRDSLEIIHSLRVRAPIPVSAMRILDVQTDEIFVLNEYLEMLSPSVAIREDLT